VRMEFANARMTSLDSTVESSDAPTVARTTVSAWEIIPAVAILGGLAMHATSSHVHAIALVPEYARKEFACAPRAAQVLIALN